MQRHDLKNHNTEQDENGLSRRNFFSRIAVGAALSLALPCMAYAEKTNKNNRLTTKPKSSARLPKYLASHDIRSHNNSNVSVVHTATSRQKTSNSKAISESVKTRLKKNNPKQTILIENRHTKQHSRIQAVYSHQNSRVIHSTQPASHKHSNGGRLHSVIGPAHKPTVLADSKTPPMLAEHSRLNSHRSLTVQNPHTGDKLSLTYFEQGRYISDALNEISFLLRDYRTGDVHPIDPELLDQLHDLKQMLGIYQPFDVICGYRSPLTNARLHAEHSGVANNSFHMHGRAVDIRVERFDLRRIHNAALAMHRGGVGYYPESNFMHLDTGSFRTWTL